MRLWPSSLPVLDDINCKLLSQTGALPTRVPVNDRLHETSSVSLTGSYARAALPSHGAGSGNRSALLPRLQAISSVAFV